MPHAHISITCPTSNTQTLVQQYDSLPPRYLHGAVRKYDAPTPEVIKDLRLVLDPVAGLQVECGGAIDLRREVGKV